VNGRVLCQILLASTIPVVSVAAGGERGVAPPPSIPSFLGYVPNEFIVVLKPEVGMPEPAATGGTVVHVGDAGFDALADRFAVTRIRPQFPGAEPGPRSRTAELARYHKVQIEAGSLEEALDAFRAHPWVETAEPIGIHAMCATPNDPYSSQQWYLDQISGHDIDSPESWNLETGSDELILAILDSGARYYHRDLGGAEASLADPGAARGNMWINKAELDGAAGVDDDGNGYVDDWIGYDFVDAASNCWPGEDCSVEDNDPRDFNGHGTHTAGIACMLTNDGYGMAGVAGGWGTGSPAVTGNGVRVMALRTGYSYDYMGREHGVVTMDAAAEALYYAADNGARIASCSWGSSNSGGLGAAATYFIQNGGIIFVAAGNDGTQIADYLNGRGDCISVAATDEKDNAAHYTRYGTWVDICAPGNNIYATYHDHDDPATDLWISRSGTSTAAPMAAAVCALVWSRKPGWTAAQVKARLFASADNVDSGLSAPYIGKMGAGRVNAFQAVSDGPDPQPVSLPESFALAQNYPNPFNASTTIAFSLPEAAHVDLVAYNALGRPVAILVDRRYEAGDYEVVWDARRLPSGVYFYRLRAGAQVVTRRTMLLK
jgi:subtilisin family serine protease